jgi:hypothetical protein
MERQSAYDRLTKGETVKLSEFEMGNREKNRQVFQVFEELNLELVTGQFTLPDETGGRELILNRVCPIIPEKPKTNSQIRREALDIINGSRMI